MNPRDYGELGDLLIDEHLAGRQPLDQGDFNLCLEVSGNGRPDPHQARRLRAL